MIQRIQTIYLLGASILLALCFFLPVVAITTATGQTDTMTFRGLSTTLTGKTLNEIISFAGGFTVAFTLGTIFFYKRRKRQMTLCLLDIVLQIVVTFLVFIEIGTLKNIQGSIVAYKFPLVFPLISAVLTYMAHRAIKKDEELVRSYDRLR